MHRIRRTYFLFCVLLIWGPVFAGSSDALTPKNDQHVPDQNSPEHGFQSQGSPDQDAFPHQDDLQGQGTSPEQSTSDQGIAPDQSTSGQDFPIRNPGPLAEDIPGILAGAIAGVPSLQESGQAATFLEHYLSDSVGDVIKCLTPFVILYEEIRDQLDAPSRQKISNILSFDVQSAEMFESESGRFQLYFYRDGFHAVPEDDENGSGIPDYIERAAEYADESWEIQVSEIGFEDPAEAGPLSIIFENTGSQTYGYTVADGQTTRIVVHHTFIDFPPNDDPDGDQLGALKVTIAHELKHSIQYATNRWRGNAGSFDWVEVDATKMENIVYPQVNDYYHYIGGAAGIFGNPRRSTPVAYSHVTWPLFFAEYLGMAFWRDTWREIREDHHMLMKDAMMPAFAFSSVIAGIANPTFSTKNTNISGSGSLHSTNLRQYFATLFARNYLWHAGSGSRAIPGYGFAEADAYPDAFMEQHHSPVSEHYEDEGQLNHFSGTYRMFRPGPGQVGQITIDATHSHTNFAIGVLGFRTDGTAAEWIVPAGNGGSDEVTLAASPFQASELDSFIVVLVNSDYTEPVSYSLSMEIRSVPDVVTLEANFPNPFSGSATNIVFSVPESVQVTITVYDVTGRRVGTILDESVVAGRHTVPFSAEGLASGVYIYRLRTDNVQETRKMTLIR